MDPPVGAACPLVAAVEAQARVGDRLLAYPQRRAGIEDLSHRQQALERDARWRHGHPPAPEMDLLVAIARTGTKGIQFSGTGV